MLQFPGSGSSGSFAGAGSGLLSADMFFGVDSFFFPLFWGVFFWNAITGSLGKKIKQFKIFFIVKVYFYVSKSEASNGAGNGSRSELHCFSEAICSLW